MYAIIETLGDIINTLFIKKQIKGYQMLLIEDDGFPKLDWTIMLNNGKATGGTFLAGESMDIRMLREIVFMAIEQYDPEFERPYGISDLYREATDDELEELEDNDEEICDDEE